MNEWSAVVIAATLSIVLNLIMFVVCLREVRKELKELYETARMHGFEEGRRHEEARAQQEQGEGPSILYDEAENGSLTPTNRFNGEGGVIRGGEENG